MVNAIAESEKLYLSGNGGKWNHIGLDHHDIIRCALNGEISAWITIHNDGDIVAETIFRDKEGRIIDTGEGIESDSFNMPSDLLLNLSSEQQDELSMVLGMSQGLPPTWNKIDLRLTPQQVRELYENKCFIETDVLWGVAKKDEDDPGTPEVSVKKILDGESFVLRVDDIFVLLDEVIRIQPKQSRQKLGLGTKDGDESKQNSFVIKAKLCHITFQGEQFTVKDGQPLRAIAGRLAEPYEEWKPPVVSSSLPCADAKTKSAIQESLFSLNEKMASCEITEEKEALEDKLGRLLKYIKEIGGHVQDNGTISWFFASTNKAKRSFQTNVRRGLESIQNINPLLAQHLKKYLLPGYCYRPPIESNIQWFVEMEPEKIVYGDPLEKMTEEEKKIHHRDFYDTDN